MLEKKYLFSLNWGVLMDYRILRNEEAGDSRSDLKTLGGLIIDTIKSDFSSKKHFDYDVLTSRTHKPAKPEDVRYKIVSKTKPEIIYDLVIFYKDSHSPNSWEERLMTLEFESFGYLEDYVMEETGSEPFYIRDSIHDCFSRETSAEILRNLKVSINPYNSEEKTPVCSSVD